MNIFYKRAIPMWHLYCKRTILALILSIFITSKAQAVIINLVNNGDFESGDVSGWSVHDNGGGPNTVPWSATNIAPAQGIYSIYADGNFTISQMFPLISASEIISATAYIREPINPNITFTTMGLGFIYSDSTRSSGGFYGTENWEFVDFKNPDFGFSLDMNKFVVGVYVDGYTSGNPGFDISEIDGISILYDNGLSEVSAIPEPATMLLFGAGLVGSFLRKRRI